VTTSTGRGSVAGSSDESGCIVCSAAEGIVGGGFRKIHVEAAGMESYKDSEGTAIGYFGEEITE
jgi:hypothetical protein